VRPAAARSFLAQHADFLLHGDRCSRLDRRVDRMEVAVAISFSRTE
jgi:hypothetical protein